MVKNRLSLFALIIISLLFIGCDISENKVELPNQEAPTILDSLKNKAKKELASLFEGNLEIDTNSFCFTNYEPEHVKFLKKEFYSNLEGYMSNRRFLSEEHFVFAQMFDTIGERKVLATDTAFGDYEWEITFGNGIIYTYRDVPEKNSFASLEIPCSNKDFVIPFITPFIEPIYISEDFYFTKYAWNESKTQYAPIDNDVGCYYEIEIKDTTSILTWSCGC